MADAGTSLHDQPKTITIRTPRLELKTTGLFDLDDVMLFISRLDVMQWATTPPMQNRDQGERWLSARSLGPDVINFAIRERDEIDNDVVKPRVIGLMGSFHRPSVGYLVHPDFAGKGYATETLRAYIPFFFSVVPSASDGGVGWDHIEGSTHVRNLPSQRVLEKAGLVRCEMVKREMKGEVKDVVVFRMPRPGKTLKELGLDAESLMVPPEDPPVPPVA